jgi:SAM-dependent methyltransferase
MRGEALVPELPSWAPQGVDPHKANIARVYDYWLGGTHNFSADQDVARAVCAVAPHMRGSARANRAFLRRAVRYMAAEAGIRQFLDIGSGIPTEGNVHEIAQEAAPGARVVYVDLDPVAIAHSRAILAENPDATIIKGDLRDPRSILAHPETRRLIDFREPVGLVLAAVLHFLTDEDDPHGILSVLREALVPGSHLAISHATQDAVPAMVTAARKAYLRSVRASVRLRSREEITELFSGYPLLDPGVVHMTQWRPDPEHTATADTDPARLWVLVGVGRKP